MDVSRAFRSLLTAAVFFTCVAESCAVAAADSNTVVLDYTTDWLNLVTHSAVLEDPTRELDFSRVRNLTFSRSIVPFAHPSSIYWLRFQYVSEPAERFYLFFGFKPAYVDAYVVSANGAIVHERTGGKVPFALRPRHDLGVLDLPLEAASVPATAYLRVDTIEPSTAVSIESHDLLVQALSVRTAMTLGLCTVLLLLLVMSIMLAVWYRRTLYAYYSVYVCAQLLYRLNDVGVASAYFWPYASFSLLQGNLMFDGLTLTAGTLFVRRYLNLRAYSVVLDNLNLFVGAVGLVFAICALLGLPVRMTLAWNFALFYAPLSLASIAYCWMRGHGSAKYLFLARAPFMIGMIMLDAKNFGLWSNQIGLQLVFSYAPYFGLTFESMMLMLVLVFDARRLREFREVGVLP